MLKNTVISMIPGLISSSIKDQFPMQISDPSRYLRNNRNIETTDSLYRYLVHISEHLTEGEVAPLEMVIGRYYQYYPE